MNVSTITLIVTLLSPAQAGMPISDVSGNSNLIGSILNASVAFCQFSPAPAPVRFPGGGQGGPPRFGGPGPTEAEKENARIRIGMTKEQQAQIDAVFHESDLQMGEVRGKFMEFSKQLYSLYDSYDFDRVQAHNIRKELLKLHKRMAENHADNEEKLRKILTREQFERMRALVKEERDRKRKEFEERQKRGAENHRRP